MINEKLTIICDEVISLEPIHCEQPDNPPVVKIVLDDVDLDKLLTELASKLDAEYILDYLSNRDILRYTEAREYEMSAKLDHMTDV